MRDTLDIDIDIVTMMMKSQLLFFIPSMSVSIQLHIQNAHLHTDLNY